MADEAEQQMGLRQGVLCPAVTEDYRIVQDERGGFKVVANRFIKKGKRVMRDSLEFPFSDVQDGDYMWMCSCSIDTSTKKTNSKELHDDTIFDKSMALSLHLFNVSTQVKDVPEHIPFTVALILILVVLSMNAVAILFRMKLRQRKKW